MNLKSQLCCYLFCLIAAFSHAQSLQDSITENVRGITFKIRLVKGGTFTMGCTESLGNCDERELPPHKVTLDDYYMAETEVTQALWQIVMGSNPSKFNDCNSCPVEQISYLNIIDFITKLNNLTGKTYRLPSEAEWEFAARGGNNAYEGQYAGSDSLSDIAWFITNADNKSHPVATKSPNTLGLYDLCGNVWEWCDDWYDSYNKKTSKNPHGPTHGEGHLYRGGIWYSIPSHCRVTTRNGNFPSYITHNLGFRLAMSALSK